MLLVLLQLRLIIGIQHLDGVITLVQDIYNHILRLTQFLLLLLLVVLLYKIKLTGIQHMVGVIMALLDI